MAIFLPPSGWLITFWNAMDDPDSFPGDPLSFSWPLLFGRSELGVSADYDPRLLEGDLRIRSIQQAWPLFRQQLEVLGASLPDQHHGRYLDGVNGPALLYTDREQALADLASVYEPVHLLMQVRLSGPGPARGLAQQVLDGEQGTLAALADALQQASSPLAGVVRALHGPEVAVARLPAAVAAQPQASAPGAAPAVTLEPVRRFNQGRPSGTLAFAPDGILLATTCIDGTLRLWNVSSGQAAFSFPLDGAVMSCAWSADGSLLAAGTSEGDLFVWEMPAGRERFFRHSWQGAFYALAFSPDGKLLASGNHKGSISLWDPAAGGADRGQAEAHRGRVWAVAFHPAGQLLASAAEDGNVRLWEMGGSEGPRAAGAPLRLSRDQVSSLAWHPSGSWLAAGGLEGGVRLWHPGPPPHEGSTVTVPAPVHAISVSRDGKRFAAADAVGAVHLWGCSGEDGLGRPVGTFVASPRPLHGIDFAPDGCRLATASEDGVVAVWEVDGLFGG